MSRRYHDRIAPTIATIAALTASAALFLESSPASHAGPGSGSTFQGDDCDVILGSAPSSSWFELDYGGTSPSWEGGCVWANEADLFVRYVAPVTGNLRAVVCSGGDVSPQWIVAARHTCEGGFIACGFNNAPDDVESCFGGAEAEFNVEAGQVIFFRIAAENHRQGANYGQSMRIEVEPISFPIGDLNHDFKVNGLDLGLLFANWTG
ncbi:MAG: hypothetical protein GY728_14930 [Phycisphaeraceae bacterium]|nr:hypothetical protein [Phycisphaerae bacterium]MCP3861484.1 hypothetical protein [Phycisphaeraceae bacterium]MCP4014395.1 hypothetical protein [Phycisphaeraceae bacterium]MCP4938228.1 hypothetical protein [Phycisphaeraceae bacterium]